MEDFSWQNSIDKQIREAMKEGKFDNLKGKGKPLGLEEDIFVDNEKWLGHHLLKENGFTLPWISRRNDIQAQIESTCHQLQQNFDIYSNRVEFREHDPQAIAMWRRAKEGFEAQIAGINKRIDNYNLMVPSDIFRMMRLSAAVMIKKLESGDHK